jgi:glutaredoxin 2
VDKLTKQEQKNLAVRKEIIRGMQEEIVELDAFIKAKSGTTGIVDPEDAKLRRKLVRNLYELKKLFFPKPKVLTDAERAEAQVALQSWNKYLETLLKQQPVPH